MRHSTRGGKCGVSLACAKSVSVTRVRPLRGHLAIAGSSCLNYHRHRRGSYNSTLTVSELTRNWFNFNSFFFFFLFVVIFLCFVSWRKFSSAVLRPNSCQFGSIAEDSNRPQVVVREFTPARVRVREQPRRRKYGARHRRDLAPLPNKFGHTDAARIWIGIELDSRW